MSSPQPIETRNNDSLPSDSRRRSISRLTRSPLSASPILSNSPSRYGSKSNSFSANAPFLKKHFGNDEAVDSGSSYHSSKGGLHADVFHASDDEPESGNKNNIDGNGNNTNIDGNSSKINDSENGVDFASGIDDPKLIRSINRHLKSDEASNLEVEGGDITRDLYRLGNDHQTRYAPKRSRSLSSSDLENSSRRGSFASSLNVPGGFRREFIVNNNKHLVGSRQTEAPSFLTRNFVEFLSIYGHFAGEDLEDDDDYIACHYKSFAPNQFGVVDEEAPLLGDRVRDHDKSINPNGTATDSKAYFLLLKSFVGTGVLFLPKAFANGGLLFSVLVLAFFGLLSYWCYLVLVYAKIATKVSGFGEIGLKLYGKGFQRLILSSIVFTQVGFVAAYIIFTAENLRSFSGLDLHIYWFIFVQVLILTPLSLIRDITKLSLAALLANVFILVGLVTILFFTFDEWLVQNHSSLGNNIEYFFNKSEFSLFIGVAIFAFEGVGLIIPIQESMIYPNNFPKVLFKVIVTISCIFILMGSIGYITFGEDVQTVILFNLPRDSPLILMVQLLYAFAILLSTPIQLFPAIRLIEQKIFPSSQSGKLSLKVKWLKNLERCLCVAFTASVAVVGGQNLDKFVSFVGCFACIPLVYMYPPILHLKSCCDYSKEESSSKRRKMFWLGILDYFLVLIGSVAMLYTTYQIIFF